MCRAYKLYRLLSLLVFTGLLVAQPPPQGGSQIDQVQTAPFGVCTAPQNMQLVIGPANTGQLWGCVGVWQQVSGGGGGGGVTWPTSGYAVISNNTSSPNGLPVTQSGAASSLVETDSGGGITATGGITSGSSGVGNLTLLIGSAPSNPASGNGRIYIDSGTGVVTCLTSIGGSCMPTLSIPGTVVQTNQSNQYTTGTQDFSGAVHTLPAIVVASSGSLPATCKAGEMGFDTGASAGSNIYGCSSTNTWTAQTGGVSSSAQKLVDASSNNEITTATGSGTIVNYFNVTNEATGTAPIFGCTGDTNLDCELLANGTGSILVSAANMATSGSSAHAALSVGTNTTDGNSFGVVFNINAPSTASSSELARFSNNNTWRGSIFQGTLYMSTEFCIASGSGGNCSAEMASQLLQSGSAGFIGFANATSGGSLDTYFQRASKGLFSMAGGLESAGTKFTTSGCSVSSTTGGATAGSLVLGTNTCTVVITMNGATGLTAANGWSCAASDITAPTVLIPMSAQSATTCSLAIPSGAGSTDTIVFHAMAF